MNQCGGYGGINTSAQRHNYFFLSNRFFKKFYCFTDKMGCRPILAASAYINQKIADNFLAFCGMIYFRMKLKAIQRKSLTIITESCVWNGIGRCQYIKASRKFKDSIRMAHPDL